MKFIGPYNEEKWDDNPVSGVVKVFATGNGTVTPFWYLVFETLAETQTIAIANGTGASLSKLYYDGEEQSLTSSFLLENIVGLHELEAVFVTNVLSHTITFSKSGTGEGTIPSTIDIVDGENFTFTIAPDQYSVLTDVLLDGVSIGAVTSYTIPYVSADYTVEAVFTTTDLFITVTEGANGSVSPNGVVRVHKGDNQTFTITADTYYEINDVLVDEVTAGAVETYTFTNVTENHTIEALFEQSVFTITSSAPEFGSITPLGDTLVNAGEDSPEYALTPLWGTSGVKMVIDGIELDFAATYKFEGVGTDHTITFTTTESGTFSVPAYSNTVDEYLNTSVLSECASGAAFYHGGANRTTVVEAHEGSSGWNFYGVTHEAKILFKPNFTGVDLPPGAIYSSGVFNYTWITGVGPGGFSQIRIAVLSSDYNPATVTWGTIPTYGALAAKIELAVAAMPLARTRNLSQTEARGLITGNGDCYGLVFVDPDGIAQMASNGHATTSYRPYFAFTWSKA